MKEGLSISVVVPVFNGSSTLEALTGGILESCGDSYRVEIIMVFDNGNSKSWEKIEALAATYPDVVKGYRLEHNYGQQRALLFGAGVARGDYIITMDEDMQHDPAYIPQMMDYAVKGGYDVVYGRFRELSQPPVRRLFSVMLRKILVTFRPALPRDYSPYRVIRREVAERMKGMNGTIAFVDDYLSRITGNYGIIELQHRERADGPSSYSAISLTGLALSAIIAYTMAVPVMFYGGAMVIVFSLLPLWNRVPFMLLLSAGMIMMLSGAAGYMVNIFNSRRSRKEVVVERETC